MKHLPEALQYRLVFHNKRHREHVQDKDPPLVFQSQTVRKPKLPVDGFPLPESSSQPNRVTDILKTI